MPPETGAFFIMKYGVICTSQTRNLGDDIQSLAAIHFLRKNGITDYVCVEREELNSYSGEPLALITNGWFLHKFQNFPPSDRIKPLFIGFYSHYPSLIEKHRKYFKKHEPIGCRSTSTLLACHEHGIEAYLSGCLTLGFDEVLHKESHVCIVDAHYGAEFSKFCDAFNGYARTMGRSVIYASHDRDVVGTSYAERLGMAQSLLHLYGRSSLVITGRLHCMLPCRALNTSVKFVHPDLYDDPRFKGLEDIIGGNTPDDSWKELIKNIKKPEPDYFYSIDETIRETVDNKKISLEKSFRDLLDRA